MGKTPDVRIHVCSGLRYDRTVGVTCRSFRVFDNIGALCTCMYMQRRLSLVSHIHLIPGHSVPRLLPHTRRESPVPDSVTDSVRIMPATESMSTTTIRDLQSRINRLNNRLTAGVTAHQTPDPLSDQLALVTSRVNDLLSGRQRLNALSVKLAEMQDLLMSPDLESEVDQKVGQELLLLQEDVIQEESVLYRKIQQLEPLLDSNHLSSGVESVTKSVDLMAITSETESQAAAAAQVRSETDQMIQFYSDLMKYTDFMLAEWDKRLKRGEQNKQNKK